jgi:hypothetical protein
VESKTFTPISICDKIDKDWSDQENSKFKQALIRLKEHSCSKLCKDKGMVTCDPFPKKNNINYAFVNRCMVKELDESLQRHVVYYLIGLQCHTKKIYLMSLT